MEACALNSGRMSVRSGITAALAAGVSLGAGAPLGREGPAVHIGASVSAWLAERLGLDRNQSLALLGCGAAAAVTVSFNTPIAAVIFALEVIVGYYTLRVFAPVVIAAMVAVVVRHALFHEDTAFTLPDYVMASLWELLPFALLGVCGALVARLVIAIVAATQWSWQRLDTPLWLRPTVAGLFIGLLALPMPLLLSVGTEGIAQAYQGQLATSLLLSLLIAKILAVGIAMGSGFAGGVFSPAVYIGAMLGGASWLLTAWLPWSVSEQGVYAIVGTAAVASAMLGAPISTMLIVFELTHNYQITLGVMTAAAFASTVMQLGPHSSFFRWQLARRNVNLTAGRDLSLLMTHRVGSLVSSRYLKVGINIGVAELERRMGREHQRIALFVDDEGRFHGSIGIGELVSHAIEHDPEGPAIAAARPADYRVLRSTNIVTALQSMAENQADYVPAIDDDSEGDTPPAVAGVILKNDLLTEHYNVMKRARQHEFGIT